MRDNFEQANTQITTFTGGNANLEPEESDSYTLGVVYSPGWAEGQAWSQKLDVELGYYHHEIEGAIQARDLQELFNACLNQGNGTDATLCSAFTRQTNGNLNPPNNFLQNFATVETSGMDAKLSWLSPEWSFGTLTASLQTTYVRDYSAVDGDGIRAGFLPPNYWIAGDGAYRLAPWLVKPYRIAAENANAARAR